jgi:hypothetical protein
MQKCAYCGLDNADDAISCASCGTPLKTPESASLPAFRFRERITTLLGYLTTRQKGAAVALCILVVSLSVCFLASHFHRPRMSETEVVKVANTAAVAEGFYLDEFRQPRADFEFRKRDRTWRVLYWAKIPAPWDPPAPPRRSAHGAPDNFFIIVDDRTKRTDVGMLIPVGVPNSNKTKQLPVIPGVRVLGWYTQRVDGTQPSVHNLSSNTHYIYIK